MRPIKKPTPKSPKLFRCKAVVFEHLDSTPAGSSVAQSVFAPTGDEAMAISLREFSLYDNTERFALAWSGEGDGWQKSLADVGKRVTDEGADIAPVAWFYRSSADGSPGCFFKVIDFYVVGQRDKYLEDALVQWTNAGLTL